MTQETVNTANCSVSLPEEYDLCGGFGAEVLVVYGLNTLCHYIIVQIDATSPQRIVAICVIVRQ